MDPELRKLLAAAHDAGASDVDLKRLIDRWEADHAAPVEQPAFRPGDEPKAPTDISAQLQRQVDKQQQRSDLSQRFGFAGAPRSVGEAFHHAGAEIVNAAQGIPGVRALEAGARSVVRGQPYEQALGDIDQVTGSLPASDQRYGKLLGAAPLAAIPGSPAVVGGIIGGADQLLSADPQSMGSRLGKTAVGAAGGAAIGRLFDIGATKLRANAGPSFASEAFARGDEAKAVNDLNYGAARAAAAGREPTPQIRALLQNPDFEPMADRLAASPQFRGMDRTDPRFLNELYKTLSDKGVALQKGLAQIDPANANVRRVQLGDVKLLKQQLLEALETPGVKPPITFNVPRETHTVEPRITPEREPLDGPPMPGTLNTYTSQQTPDLRQALRDFPNPSTGERQGPAGSAFRMGRQPQVVKPGVEVTTPAMRIETAPAEAVPPYMPGYRDAVRTAAQQKAEQKMLSTGYKALKANSTGHALSEKAALNYSPEALQRIAQDPTKSDAEKAALVQGILTSLKAAPSIRAISHPLGVPIPWLSREARVAPGLIRKAGAPNQGMIDFLTKLGLLTAQPAASK